jgi:hypothetical protein
VKRNGRDEIGTCAGVSMIIIRQKDKIFELVEERWSCGCIAGEKDKLS